MASSFSTEMPTSSAVFGEEVRQPFMTTVIEKKFENVKEVGHITTYFYKLRNCSLRMIAKQ